MLDRATVTAVAQLARLNLSAEETDRLATDLAKIAGHIDRLKEVDVSGVELGDAPTHNPLRADEVLPSLPPADALRNAPQAESGYFRMPQVVE